MKRNTGLVQRSLLKCITSALVALEFETLKAQGPGSAQGLG